MELWIWTACVALGSASLIGMYLYVAHKANHE